MMNWDKYGIDISQLRNGKTFCPKCHHERTKHKNERELSVDIERGLFNCHHCSFAGCALEKKKREHIRPLDAQLNLSDKAQKYLESRGLSSYTIQRFKIGESAEFMPQTGKSENCLNFKYYRNGELVNIKYRDGAKNFKLVKDAELIFFNLDSLEGAKECVITEGEFDCIAVAEAGYYEVISVPNGASKGSQKLEYLDNCYESLAGMERIVIATDGDVPGISLRNELARRLGRHRCFYVEYPEGRKDFNEVLLNEGKEAVKGCIEGAKAFPVDGIFKVEDIESELDYHYEHGFTGGVELGYGEFDQLFSVRPGELTTITGIPGSGKSALVDDWLERLSSRHGWKHGICSPENQPVPLHISKLASNFVGKPFYRANAAAKMTRNEWDFAKYFVNEHFFFFNISEVDMTIDGVLEKGAELVLRYGINTLLIDPWNTLDHNIPAGMNETQFVSKSLTKITAFAKKYSVHVFLVAHPTKIQKDKNTGKYEVPTLYSISGSAHFFNKTDNGITIYRDFETNLITIYVQKVRFFFVGKIGFSSFIYDLPTGRYAEEGCQFEVEAGHYSKRIGADNIFNYQHELF